MTNVIQSKRFVVRQSLVGKDATINVTFKNGKTATYNHDKVFAIMKDKLETMACWRSTSLILRVVIYQCR